MRLKLISGTALAISLSLTGCSGGESSSTSSSSGSIGGTATGARSSSSSGSTAASSGSRSSSSSGTSAATSAGTSAGTTGGTSAGTTGGTSAATTGGTSAGTSGGTVAGSSSGGSTGTTATTSNPTVTGSTGSTGSGSTGGTSAGTTGSTGSTGSTGNAGQIDTDCGTAHTACNDGQHCNRFTRQSGLPYYICTCDEGDSSTTPATPDTCDGNLNGKTICDSVTSECRAPRDFEDANLNATTEEELCDVGYTPVNFGTRADPDLRCIQTCTTGTDCSAVMTYCLPDVLTTTLPDGGSGGSEGACVYNICGPNRVTGVYPDGGDVADGGTIPDPSGQWFSACDSAGTGDGTCIPLTGDDENNNGNPDDYSGICFRNGNVTNFSAQCSGFFGQVSGACTAGSLCLGSGEPANNPDRFPTALCVPSCNAGTGYIDGGLVTTCPSVQGQPTTCGPFSVTIDSQTAEVTFGFCQ